MFWIYQHAHYSHWTSADIWLKVLFISPDVSEESLYLSSLTRFGFAPSISDRAYQVVLLSLASCLSFMNILLDLETSEHRIRVVVSQAADRVLTLKDTFKISKVWNLCFMRRLSSLQKANHDIKPCFNSVVFCLFVLLYLQLHQHWYSAGFLRNDFKFHYRSCITFLPIFFLIFLQSADFISFLPSHFSILSCLRNKHCWNTLETYLPNDNFLFITASGD